MNWLTAAGIIFSIGLGVFNLVSTQREKQRRVHVTLKYQAPDAGPSFVGSVVLTATNPGYRTVFLESGGLFLPEGRKVVYTTPRPVWYGINTSSSGPPPSLDPPEDNHSLPYHLAEGENHVLPNSPYAVAESIRRQGVSGKLRIRGYYMDVFGKVYKSKPLTFDTEEWPSKTEESS